MPRRRVTKGMIGVVLGALSALLALLSWAVSSPAGSAPDEPFHLASTWCGQGTDEDHCQQSPLEKHVRLVPAEVMLVACFVGKSTVTGDCRPADFGDHLAPTQPDAIGNWNDPAYPPVYYAVMHVFATGNLDASVLMIRFANVAVALLMIGGLALLVPRRLRRIPTTAFLVSSVPLALFIGTSVNPSAWAIISIGTLWLAVYASYETTGTRQRLLWAFALLATLIGAGSRADAALFAVMAIGLALGLRSSELRRQWRSTLVAGIGIVLAAGLFISSGHSSAVAEGIPGYDPAPVSGLALLVANAMSVPFLWSSSLGMGPLSTLGWFDTPLPFIVGFLSLVVCGFVVVHGWAQTWWQKTVAIGLTIAGMAAYPLIVLQESRVFTGTGVQPRYVLPLLVMLVGISLLPHEEAHEKAHEKALTWGRLQVVGLVAALSLAQSVALYANLMRYVEGEQADQIGFLGGGWWWQDLPGSPWVVWGVGTVAFTVLSATVLGQWWPSTRRTTTAAETETKAAPSPVS